MVLLLLLLLLLGGVHAAASLVARAEGQRFKTKAWTAPRHSVTDAIM
jgi:hypothetical protein